MASVENSLFTFINNAVIASGSSSALHGAQVDEATYALVTAQFGIRIGDSNYKLAPQPGGTAMSEFDATIDVIIFAEVAENYFDRSEARDKVKAMVRELALLFINDPSIGGAVRDSRFLDAVVGWDSQQDGRPYCVASMPFIYNETGQQLSGHY
jgi:hypothetical protein